MSRIVFFCHDDRLHIESFEYYKQDIDALEALGHEVIICTKYSEIPLRFDAMFVWWWTYALYPAILCRIINKPCIITGTYNFRFPVNYSGRDYFKRPLWQRALIRSATTISSLNLFVNEAELEGCSAHFGLRNGRYYPHIVSEDYLKGPSNERKNILFNLAWSGKQNLIRKGIPELLNAIHILKSQGFKVSLSLAGHKGDGIEFLQTMIRDLGIENEVTLLGPLTRDNKINMLRTSEVYVQPSHYEGFGVAIAEAMGCGACVITCDVGAVKSVVGDCGIYVPPGAPEELAKAIKTALSDNDLRGNLQKCSHKRAVDCFAADKKIERLKQYLSEIGIS